MLVPLAVAGIMAASLTAPAGLAASAGPGTPVVFMCRGAEDHVTRIERRPADIVLECAAYGPQYGNPNVAVLEDLSWLTWGRTSARGYGMLTYGSPLVCAPNSPCTGGETTRIVAQVRLSNPRAFGRASTRRTFTRVTVTVSGLPDTGFGRQTLTYTPPRVAYS